MKNTECTIYITTKHGWTQSYRKEKNGWTQTCPNGVVRQLSAEQLLSHILPPLAAGNQDHVSVRVEPDVIEKKIMVKNKRRGERRVPKVRDEGV
ncbi:MAG: hypothetical protein WC974_04460 [Thermoplasmata archaeon]